MHATKNDIPLQMRKKIADLLNRSLSDAIDLKTQIKQAHWTVKGPDFIALHELFDRVATSVDNAADLVAERVMQLGGQALGTARVAAKQSRLKEYPLTADTAQEHVEAVSNALSAFVTPLRKSIDEVTDLNDAVSADILTGIAGDIDKQLWFVESHLEK